ncbi:MAG: hypothetical protein IKR69_04330 [Bacteroidales bacterium]|nr:hypothetical protein [Bacteroidales bacterium]
MKKILSFIALTALLFSCTKGNSSSENDDIGGGEEYSGGVVSINVPESIALLAGSGETLIPIILEPSGLDVEKYISVSGGDDAVFTWRLSGQGIFVTPVASGSAQLKVKALQGRASDKDITIQVINGIKSFSIDFSPAWAMPYISGTMTCLTVGKKYLMRASITDDDSHTVNTPVQWKVEGEGIQLVSNGLNGEITVTGAQKTATITATLPVGGKSVSKLVYTYAAPTAIVLSEDSSSMELKSKVPKIFYARVEPEGAIQNLSVSSSSGILTCNASSAGSGNWTTRLELKASESSHSQLSLDLASAVSTSVSRSVSISVTDFDANDVKSGDYVYYNSSTRKFRSSDCGKRYDGWSYKDNLVQPDPDSGEEYVGIIMKVLDNSNLPTASFHGLTESKLAGLSNSPGKHVMVWSKKEVKTFWDFDSPNTQRYQSSWGTDEYGFIFTEKLTAYNIDIIRALKNSFPSIGNYSNGTTGWFIPQRSSCFSSAHILNSVEYSFGTSGTMDFRVKYEDYPYKGYWTPSDDPDGLARIVVIEAQSTNGSWYIETGTRYGNKDQNRSGDTHVYLLRPAFII